MHESHAGSPVSGKRCLELGSGTGAGWGVGKKERNTLTPLKINMEHNHGGLEDHFPC